MASTGDKQMSDHFLRENTSTVVKPGIYLHFKGNRYEVQSVGKLVDEEVEYVVYKQLYDGKEVFIRELTNFVEKVWVNGVQKPRFTFIGEATKKVRHVRVRGSKKKNAYSSASSFSNSLSVK
jgi:hypothetical protein